MNVTPDISIGQFLTLLLTVVGFAVTNLTGWFALKAQAGSTAEKLETLAKSTTDDLGKLKSAVKESVDKLGDRFGSVERTCSSCGWRSGARPGTGRREGRP